MAGESRLYPPVIEGTLPAIIKNTNGTESAQFSVPFSLNKAVSVSSIKGFSIKISSIASSSVLGIIEITDSAAIEEILSTAPYTISYTLTPPNDSTSALAKLYNLLTIGQYVKLQLAFIDKTIEIGENETPIITYTTGYYSTVGTAKISSMPAVEVTGLNTEGMFLFNYTYTGIYTNNDSTEKVYEYKFNLYHGPDLFQTSGWLMHDNTLNETLTSSSDTYTFKDNLQENETYYIEYVVKTANYIEAASNKYKVIKVSGIKSDFDNIANLIAENNFDNGYIRIHLEPVIGHENQVNAVSGTFRILRASTIEPDLWEEIARTAFYSGQPISNWYFKDFTIEQGKEYRYALQQYNTDSIYSDKILSNYILADFEDIFIYDGNKQLKLRFNPKVSSFKIDRQEQKLETIGSQYPFFFRNGKIQYHEFPISGLISYLSDEEELFMTNAELGLVAAEALERDGSPSAQILTSTHVRTRNLLDYNFAAERIFKNAVLDWLGDGNPKLFRSPGEGNFIVRLMNISLSPEDKVSRMLHNVSATAYEIADCNYENLHSLGFIQTINPVEYQYFYKTDVFDPTTANNSPAAAINTFPATGYLQILNAAPGVLFQVTQQPLGENVSTQLIAIPSTGSYTIDLEPSTIINIYPVANQPYRNFYCTVTYKYIAQVELDYTNVENVSINTVLMDWKREDQDSEDEDKEAGIISNNTFFGYAIYQQDSDFGVIKDTESKKVLNFCAIRIEKHDESTTTNLKVQIHNIDNTITTYELPTSNGVASVDLPAGVYKAIYVQSGIHIYITYFQKEITFKQNQS